MNTDKKHRISIPIYSLSEDLINAITHGLGALAGVAALVLCVLCALGSGRIGSLPSAIIYGVTLIVLYTMSSIYHSLRGNKAKRVFRVIDHCSIFLLIAGTYTPFTLVALRDTIGVWLFCAIWAVAVLGITLNAIDLKKFAVASIVCYVGMGWAMLFAYNPLAQAVDPRGIALLIWGGVAYTVGAVLYAVGKKQRYFHSLFHFLCLVGSVLHFLAIYWFVL